MRKSREVGPPENLKRFGARRATLGHGPFVWFSSGCASNFASNGGSDDGD